MPKTSKRLTLLRSRVEGDWDLFNRLDDGIDTLLDAVPGIQRKAAEKATRVTRLEWNSVTARPLVAKRRGRPTTGGTLDTLLEWREDGESGVRFDVRRVDSEAPYWIIHEIGTGKRSTMRAVAQDGQTTNKGISIKGRRGDYIPAGLVWADGGNYVRPSNSRRGKDNIRAISQVSLGATKFANRGRRKRVGRLKAPRVQIRRETRGRNMVGIGGREGMATYLDQLTRAAEKTLGGRNAPRRR